MKIEKCLWGQIVKKLTINKLGKSKFKVCKAMVKNRKTLVVLYAPFAAQNLSKKQSTGSLSYTSTRKPLYKVTI